MSLATKESPYSALKGLTDCKFQFIPPSVVWIIELPTAQPKFELIKYTFQSLSLTIPDYIGCNLFYAITAIMACAKKEESLEIVIIKDGQYLKRVKLKICYYLLF